VWLCTSAEVAAAQKLTVFYKGTTKFLDTQQNKENIYLSYKHYFSTNVSNFLNVWVGSKKNVLIFAKILLSTFKSNYCNFKQKKSTHLST